MQADKLAEQPFELAQDILVDISRDNIQPPLSARDHVEQQKYPTCDCCEADTPGNSTAWRVEKQIDKDRGGSHDGKLLGESCYQ